MLTIDGFVNNISVDGVESIIVDGSIIDDDFVGAVVGSAIAVGYLLIFDGNINNKDNFVNILFDVEINDGIVGKDGVSDGKKEGLMALVGELVKAIL